MMQQFLKCALLSSAALLSCAAAAQDAPATPAGGLEEIIVTASKTGATRLQDTPLSVTAFSADTLSRTGIKDIRDLATLTPNLLVTQNGSFAQIYIRGIGSNNVFGGSDPSSTIHIDGIYMARPASYFGNFLDVERIEVLRGPQGTLYGRNSVGGTINIISRKPTEEVAAKAQLTYGNYDQMRGEAYVSGPLIDNKLFASLSVLGTRHDGYLKNVGSAKDADSEKTYGVRGQLRYTPTDRLEAIVRADYMKSDDTLAGYIKLLQSTTDPIVNTTLGNFREVATNISPTSRRRQRGVAGEINYDLSDTVQLKSLTGYRENRLRSVTDTDATTLNVRRTDQFEGQRQFSQEFNLTGKTGGFSYIVGAYLFDEHIDIDSAVTTFATTKSRFQPVVNTEALAGFGQGSYALTDKLSLTAGIRYTHERKDFDQLATLTNATTGVISATYPRIYSKRGIYTAWTPKFSIEFRPLDDVLVYATVTKGFKSGGYSFSSINPAQGFAPESLWSYEAGAKVDFLDHMLRVNATAFHYDYKNLQVQSFLTPGVIDITNASNAKVDGFELETTAKPVSWLQLGANLAYLDARYKNYLNALGPGNIPFDASGNRLSLAPKWAYTLYAQGEMPVGNGSVVPRVEYSFRTRQFFTAGNSGLDTQAGFGLVNASLGYNFPGDRIEILAYGRNLTDKAFITSTASFASGIVGRVGEPRTYGVRAIFKY